MAARDLEALILTNEFPPSVYGGAGIHVGELSRELRVTVSPAGRVRMCDPSVSDAADIRNCSL